MQKSKDRCCIQYRGMFCLETTISQGLAVVDRTWLPLRGQRLDYAPLKRHLMLTELYLAITLTLTINPTLTKITFGARLDMRSERERESEHLTLNAVEVVVVIVPLLIGVYCFKEGGGKGFGLQLQRIFHSIMLVRTFTKLERRSF